MRFVGREGRWILPDEQPTGIKVVSFRANTRTRKVFAELKRTDRAWRKRVRDE